MAEMSTIAAVANPARARAKTRMHRKSFLVGLLLIPACAVSNVRPGYQLNPDEDRGVLAVGITGSDDMSNFSWYLRKVGSNVTPIRATAINFHTWRDPLTWEDPRGRLAVVDLEAGEYEFFDWGAADSSAPKSYFSIPFTIRPGRVTYLGRLHIDLLPEEERFVLEATDHFDEDFNFLESKVSKLRSDQVDRQPAELCRCLETECEKPQRFPLIIPIVIPIP